MRLSSWQNQQEFVIVFVNNNKFMKIITLLPLCVRLRRDTKGIRSITKSRPWHALQNRLFLMDCAAPLHKAKEGRFFGSFLFFVISCPF